MDLLSKRKLLGEAAAWILFPLALVIPSLLLMDALVKSTHVTGVLLLVIAVVNITAEVVALSKLDSCKNWSFGWAKLISYILSACALLFLLFSTFAASGLTYLLWRST